MSKIFGYVNEADSNKKIRQYDLEFGKVLSYSVWLAVVMYDSYYGNYYLHTSGKYFVMELRYIYMKNLLVSEN